MSSQPVKVFFQELPADLDEAKKEYMEKYLQKLPPLAMGQFGLSPYKAHIKEDGTLLVKVIIRNASAHTMKINQMPVSVKDAKNRNVAVAIFTTKDLEIKPYSAVLKTFGFPKDDLLVDDLDMSKWSLHQQRLSVDSLRR